MSKICIVGDYDSICGFGALGIDTYPVSIDDNLSLILDNLASDDYAIILITDTIALEAVDIIDKYRTVPVPAIVPVPDLSGEGELGMKFLRKAVEQAVGSAGMIFGE